MRSTRKKGGGKPELSKYHTTSTTRNHTKPKTGIKSLTMKQRQQHQKLRELTDALQKEKNKCVVLYTKVLNQLEDILEKGDDKAYIVAKEVYDKIHLYKNTMRSSVPELFPDEFNIEDTADYLQQIVNVMQRAIPLQRLCATIANAVIGVSKDTSRAEPMAIESSATTEAPRPEAPRPEAPRPDPKILELEKLLGNLKMNL